MLQYLKPKFECTPVEIENPNNVVCLIADLHSVFDVTSERPSAVRIRATDADSTSKDFMGENGKVGK